MSDLDRMIETTLNEEDRTFLAQLVREPGYFRQVGGLLSGPLGWINLLLMVVQAALFFGGAWCAWEFFQVSDPVLALRWGLSAAVLLIVATMLKLATLWPTLQANRVLREIKRLELQVARQLGRK